MEEQRDQRFDHQAVESRWQEEWTDARLFSIDDDEADPAYVLGMFPYTSGNLHMGHVRNYTITDAYARFKRMEGEAVLHPIGWDSFGLPAENAAIERDISPREWTESCIDTMQDQMRAMGFGYDWEREVTTCDPDYYRWNQWLFNRFYDEGLVERKGSEVNWCPSCETVLADEQVEGDDEVCWRCETPVTQRDLDQWFFEITEYADELVDALDDLDGWPDSVRQMQRDWIGRQHGARVAFEVENYGPVEAFTTRLDTIYGATFFALAPDHEISEALAEENEEVRHFVEEVADPEGDEPKGVETDLTATNPATGEEVPVFVTDFVLSEVGTGALMGVPGHDERDHDFAESKGLDIVPVVAPSEDETPDVTEEPYTDDGVLVESGDYSGLDSETARERLTENIESADDHTQYRLRDWGISRQRYWGTPIPVVYCEDCGPVTVPDEDLPVELPEFVHTTGNPLDAAEEWKRVECPECGGPAERETDTMDTFVDSSWYFLRYISPNLEDAPFDTEQANDWMPVDQYVGGIEHAVMHLLYSRFVTKALSDLGDLDHREPFTNYLAQGMVLLEGEKMSKSKGNVVSPQRIVEEYGADTARLFIMQAARPQRDFDWTESGVQSSYRFLQRLYGEVSAFVADPPEGERDAVAEYVEREIDWVSAVAADDFESMTFNGALNAVRELVSLLGQYGEYTETHAPTVERGLKTTVKILAPVTPHVCEELWDEFGEDGFVAEAEWPAFEGDRETVRLERNLVDELQSDVRDIVDVAGIEDPERIEVVTSPEWKHRAHGIALDSDDGNVIGEIMGHDEIRQHGDDAADYGQYLQENRQTLRRKLPPEREAEALRRAAWLVEEEFGAEVVVRPASEASDELASKARPGRPALDVS